jgi:hypothetical protein
MKIEAAFDASTLVSVMAIPAARLARLVLKTFTDRTLSAHRCGRVGWPHLPNANFLIATGALLQW